VTAKGDTLTATLDGKSALAVTSLSALIAKESCGFPAPTGTSIGYRTWSTSVVIMTATVRSTA